MIHKKNTKNPCYGCEDRHPGCHAECERYAEWKKEVTDRNARIKAAKSSEAASYEIERTIKRHHDHEYYSRGKGKK